MTATDTFVPVVFTREQVLAALNRAANDIGEAVDAPDSGLVDALNLMVTAAATYLGNPAATLATAAADYPDDVDGLDEILGWIQEAC